MPELIWLNGEIISLSEARISAEDRGFQFADGVYEVIRIYNGKAFALLPHLSRLEKSAEGIQLQMPMKIDALASEIQKLVARSAVRQGTIYLQLTRGASPRNHIFPKTTPTLLFYAREVAFAPENGVRLISLPEDRWKRCWIKSIALLPNVLAKNAAIAAGADEAVFVEDGIITECSVSNIFAVIGGKLVTQPAGPRVLAGITRALVIDIAGTLGMEVEERAITEREAQAADEIFVTSTTREIAWVATWNTHQIAGGKCGPVTEKLHAGYRRRVLQETK